MADGIINIFKEEGFTSHDVVAKLRGILGTKKIGHTGTLDPMATGVLVVCVGKATKVSELITGRNKSYETVLLLGKTTDTSDITGTLIKEETLPKISEKDVHEAVKSFIGEIEQIPPMYSAVRFEGRHLYELAREGKSVERKSRKVTISDITIKDIDLNPSHPIVRMEVTCSKGTYIRTLCEDIGKKLSCGGCMEYLQRTRVGEFFIADSLKLEQVEEFKNEGNLAKILLPIDHVFKDLPRLTVRDLALKKAVNGNPLSKGDLEKSDLTGYDGKLCLYDRNERFIGIFVRKNDRYVPLRMML